MVLFQGSSKGEGAEKAPRSIFFKGWAFLQKVNLVTRARDSLWKESGALGKSPKECTGIHCTITIGSSTLGKRAMFARFQFAFGMFVAKFRCLFWSSFRQFTMSQLGKFWLATIISQPIIVNTRNEFQNKHWSFPTNIPNLQTNIRSNFSKVNWNRE